MTDGRDRRCHVEQIRKRTVEEPMEVEVPAPDTDSNLPVVVIPPVTASSENAEPEPESLSETRRLLLGVRP